MATLEVQTEAVWLEQSGAGLWWLTELHHSLKNTITKTKHRSIMADMLTGLARRRYFPAFFPNPVIIVINNRSVKI